MYDSFNWTKVGEARNRILAQYEPIQLFLLYQFAKVLNAEIFIDIGANVGAYTIVISSLKCVTVAHAFEPSPETFAELEKNIELNKHCRHKVKIYNTAVSDSDGCAKFGIVGDYSGANSILDTSIHAREKSKNEITVKTVPLDRVLSDASKMICMKIDVEGHEMKALRGAKNLLKNNRAIVQLEDYSGDKGNINDLMGELGYSRVLHIGPDQYFTNCSEALGDSAIVRIVECAAQELIRVNLGSTDEQRPIRVKLSKDVVIELSGKVAKFGRKAKNIIKIAFQFVYGKASGVGRKIHLRL